MILSILIVTVLPVRPNKNKTECEPFLQKAKKLPFLVYFMGMGVLLIHAVKFPSLAKPTSSHLANIFYILMTLKWLFSEQAKFYCHNKTSLDRN